MRTILLIVVSMCVTLPALGISNLGQIEHSFEAGSFDVESGDDGLQRIEMQGFKTDGAPGHPALPYQSYDLLVPPDIDWDTLEFQIVDEVVTDLPGPYILRPAPPCAAAVEGETIIDWGRSTNIVNGFDMDVYTTDAFYPAAFADPLPPAQMRKFHIVRVRFTPIRFNPVIGALRYCKQVTLRWTFKRYDGGVDAALLNDTVMDKEAPEAFLNYYEADRWYPTPEGGNALVEPDAHGYAIITTDAIVAGSGKLDDFVVHKTSLGFPVMVVTEQQWGQVTGSSPNGRDDKIRKWLKDNYVSANLEYVLLIGDPTPYGDTDISIPMKMTWPREKLYFPTKRKAPTDSYFSDLTGNWNIDGNSHYGDWDDWDTSGGVNFYPEVYVGRIPVYNNDFAALDDILEETISYETETADLSWCKNVLLPASFWDAKTDGSDFTEQVRNYFLFDRGFETWRMYQQGGGACGVNTGNPSEEELRGGEFVLNRWNADRYGIVCWTGHGSPTHVSVGYDNCKDGNLFSSDQATNLNPHHQSFTMQTSCLNGHPETTNNLQYAILRNGGIGSIGATRVSWYRGGSRYGDHDDSPWNMGIGYEWLERFTRFYDRQSAGRALATAKRGVENDIWRSFGDSQLMNLMDFNLYGDPSVKIVGEGDTRRPDLVINEGTHHVSGTQVGVTSVLVSNQSPNAAAGPCVLGFYLSEDTAFTPEDHLMGTAAVPGLGPGETHLTLLPVKNVRTMDPAIPIDVYYIGAVVDTELDVREDDEANNTYHFLPDTVTIPYPPPPPSNLQASDGTREDAVEVTWDAVAGCDYYRAYRSPNDNWGSSVTHMTDWTTDLGFTDPTADAGNTYYYWVQASEFPDGRYYTARVMDTGYVRPSTLEEEVRYEATKVDFYRFDDTRARWWVVGSRAFLDTRWGLGLYATPGFVNLLKVSDTYEDTDFIATDQTRAGHTEYGVATRGLGVNSLTIEAEAGSETLVVGTNSVQLATQDLIEIWDLPLEAGSYVVELKLTGGYSGSDLDMALFSSRDGTAHRNREEYLARSATEGAGSNELFVCTIDAADVYGLCVWFRGFSAMTEFDVIVRAPVAGLWTGSDSSDWHATMNWSDFTVPTSTTDVVIPAGTPNAPVLYGATGQAGTLSIEHGATLNVDGPDTLHVQEDLSVRGHLALTTAGAQVQVGGDIRWEDGSTANMAASSILELQGHMLFANGANVTLNHGYVDFTGTSPSYIVTKNSGCNLHNLGNRKSGSDLVVSRLCLDAFHVNYFVNHSNATFRSESYHPVVIDGWFNNLGGRVECTDGSFVFSDTSGVVPLKPNTGDFFNDLVIDISNVLALEDDYGTSLDVRGNLVIESGGLDAWNCTDIRVGGNWSNAVGLTGFNPQAGTVTFDGVDTTQDVHGVTTFHHVVDAHSNGCLVLHDRTDIHGDFLVGPGVRVHDDLGISGKLDVNETQALIEMHPEADVWAANLDMGGSLACLGGAFAVDDIVDTSLLGTVAVAGGSMTLRQGSSWFSDSIHLDGAIVISNGTLTIEGGWGRGLWPNAQDALLEMSGGELILTDWGIRIPDNAHTFSNKITGGTIRLAENFECRRAGFTPYGGTLEFAGENAVLEVAVGSHLHNLVIHSTDEIYCPSNSLVVQGDFVLANGTFTAPDLLQVGGSWSNAVGPSGLSEGTGIVELVGTNPAVLHTDETFHDLVVNKQYPDADGVHLTTSNTITVVRDLDIRDGTLSLGYASVLDIDRDLYIRKGAGLNAEEWETNIFLGRNWDNANTNRSPTVGFSPGDTIYGSSKVTFDGSGDDQFLHSNTDPERFHDLVLENDGDMLLTHASLQIDGSLHVVKGVWDRDVDGLIHTIGGNLTIDTAGSWSDSSCTLRFEGQDDQVFTDHSPGGRFGGIVVDQPNAATRLSLDSPLRLDHTSALDVDVLKGTLDLGAQALYAAKDINIFSGGELIAGPGALLQVGDDATLGVYDGGRLQLAGTDTANVMVRSFSGSPFNLTATSGSKIGARYVEFRNLDKRGVHVQSGAIVEEDGGAFSYCTFLEGAPAGAFLTIENGQTFVVPGIRFPEDPGDGAHNIVKTRDDGRLLVLASSGNFTGPGYEDDPYDRIDWGSGAPEGGAQVPSMATVGGACLLRAGVSEETLTPMSFGWTFNGIGPLWHNSDDGTDEFFHTWNMAGTNSLTLTLWNAVGSRELHFEVVVQPLAISAVDVIPIVPPYKAMDLTLSGTSAGTRYRVYRKTNMTDTDWLAVFPQGYDLPGKDGFISWSYTNGASSGFFQVRPIEP